MIWGLIWGLTWGLGCGLVLAQTATPSTVTPSAAAPATPATRGEATSGASSAALPDAPPASAGRQAAERAGDRPTDQGVGPAVPRLPTEPASGQAPGPAGERVGDAKDDPAGDPVLEQVRTLANAGHLAEAEAALRPYLAEHDNLAYGHLLLGFVLLREDKPLPSLAEYTKASHLGPTTAAELKDVALDYVLAKDNVDADKWMTQVTEWTPGDGDAWYSLGRIKYSESRLGEAETCFKKALALEPRMVKAENNLGLTYAGLNRNEDAMAAYRTAIEWQAGAARRREPLSEQPLLNLGLLLMERDRVNGLAEAVPLLEQAQQIVPTNAQVCVALGRAYERQQKLALAASELERAVALEPEVAADHFLLGQVYRKAGEAAKAKAQFDRAAALDATHSSQ